jgi:hypothetical protein
VPGAAAAVRGIASLQKGEIAVRTIQEYHQDIHNKNPNIKEPNVKQG